MAEALRNASPHVLVVEDEGDIADTLRFILEREKFSVDVAATGADGLSLLSSRTPELILLDLMLPDMSGLEVLKSVKREPALAATRIVILTARNDEIDRILGLELGADDYVAKPFSPRELVLRIRRLLEREETAPERREAKTVSVGPIGIDLEFHEVRVDGELLDLTLTEFRLLLELVQARGGCARGRRCSPRSGATTPR